MNEEKKVPDIRFTGFEKEWETDSLTNMTQFITKGTTPKDKSGKGSINFIKVENINSENGEVHITSKISEKEHNRYLSRSKLEEKDILFSIAGTLGRTTIINKELLPANTNQALAIIRLSDKNVNYIKNYLSSKAIRDYIKKNPTIGAQPNLSLEQISNFKISFSDRKEQNEIAKFFQEINNNIVLKSKKLDKFKNYKQAMLQKMFPKEGEAVPEVRFSGFKDNWEKCKVKSISSENFGGGTPSTSKEEYWNGSIPWIQSSDLIEHQVYGVRAKKYISNLGVIDSATKIIPKNSLAIVTRVGVGKVAAMNYPYATSQDFFSLSNLKVNLLFSAYLLYRKIQSELNIVQGTSIKGITKDELLLKSVYIPKKEEQKLIGEYFYKLDQNIQSKQAELDKLKQFKQAMLDKMFV